jgi:hypothetical protein
MTLAAGPLALVALVAVVAVVTVAGAVPAAALSCASDPGATPEAIAGGTFRFADGSAFLDSYDFAVVGTVVAVRTDERQGSPTYGHTEVDLEVDGVLGVPVAPARMTLEAGDPGWMVGYPFERGRSYFVPVLAEGPEGQVNWTFLCDPISEVGDPEALSTQLAGLAGGAGLPYGTPSEPGGPGDPGPSAPTDRFAWFVPAVTITALAAAATTLLVLRRRTPRFAAR